MDWTVNNGLYNRFLKWKLQCENILDCEPDILPESKNCKKVMALIGDFGMDQYVSWYLPTEDIAWIQYGPSMKIFASHKLMKSEPDVTCLQASSKEIDQ